ncbi:MAG: hypothetical protein CME65_13380 [Halobacteriovoraceae bacterium]|nr:hypothetical protein [Halobacteriovoraceae bacterium]|tara:strand:- start:25632 stop:27815 length:2184 start_codon:yes stop_codon:yes gene_type:complete
MASLERRLGLFSVITISISSMIGSGIFVLPGLGFATTGPSLYLAFLLSAICVLPAALSKAELATAMPTSGGTYVYIDRTFGPLAGTVSGLGLFLSILFKAAFSLIGIAAYLTVVSSFPEDLTFLTFLFVIVLLNILGVGKVSSFVTAILFISLVSLTILSLFSFPLWDLNNMQPLMPKGSSGLFSAAALVFVSFAGVTKIAAIAEEVKEPEKNLPRGILISLLLVTIIYCAISFVLGSVYSISEISGEMKPIYRLAVDVGNPSLGIIFAIVAALTMINTSNAGILAGSRFPFAMSRDNLLPGFLGKLHRTFLTPILSILLSGSIVAIVLLFFNVEKIAKFASAFMILGYIAENFCVIVLREARVQWYKPQYKSPLYPFMQSFGILSGVALLFAMGKIAIFAIGAIAVPGVLIYFMYGFKRTHRKGVIGIRGKRTDLIEKYPYDVGGFCSFEVQGEADVVVSLFGRERSPEMLIEMGIALGHHKAIEVTRLLEIPEQTDLHDMMDEPPELRSLRRRIIAMANEKNESITFDPVLSHDVSRTVFEISQRTHCRWLLIEWGGRRSGGITFHNPIGWLKSHIHCNLATYRDAGVRYIRKIMVYIHNDRNDSLVLETANHLATVLRANVTLVRFAHTKASDEQKYYETHYLKDLGSKLTTPPSTAVVLGDEKLRTLVDETPKYDLLVMGSTDHNLVNSISGTFDDKLIAKAACSVLAVHASNNSELTPQEQE